MMAYPARVSQVGNLYRNCLQRVCYFLLSLLLQSALVEGYARDVLSEDVPIVFSVCFSSSHILGVIRRFFSLLLGLISVAADAIRILDAQQVSH